MGLWIQISSGSDEPIYVQVAEQISEAIAKGQLATGDKLPAVRKLAAELVINPNTVARAYSRLEQAGLVTTKTGSGTFISDPKLRSGDAADINILTERMDTLITRGLNLGLEGRDLIAMFKTRLAGFANKSKSRKKKK
ncbi:MAG TPA: GntR family transcriptional regulator [Phycisphaerales bacterium]|nr:GntR family transcriptional regulator [Phycisphaerales bacterium]